MTLPIPDLYITGNSTAVQGQQPRMVEYVNIPLDPH